MFIEKTSGFCTYGAMQGTMALVFYPHFMPKGIGGTPGANPIPMSIVNRYDLLELKER
jgi:hypothetical protein